MIGPNTGRTIRQISIHSNGKPRRKISTITKASISHLVSMPKFSSIESISSSPPSTRNTYEKPVAPRKIRNTRPFDLQADTMASCIIVTVMRRFSAAMSMEPNTPTAPLSVGVAQPAKIEPMTMTISAVIGNRPRHTAVQNSRRVCGPYSGGSLGALPGLQDGDGDDVDEEQPREHEPRHGGGQEQRPRRGRQHLRHHHQHDGGRDEDAERAGRGDGADGQPLVVARREHLRQRDHRERDHRGADHADRRGQDGAHHHDGDRQRARDPLQQHLRRLQHVHRRARPLQDRAHEDEHGDRRQHRIGGHAAPHAQHDVVEPDQLNTPRNEPTSAKTSAIPPMTNATG